MLGDPPPSPHSLSVVVMAYNEAANLEAVVREIAGVLARSGRDHEILLIDDGSSDGTGELADRLAGEIPATRVIHHRANGGLGAVYRTGYGNARCDLVTFFPADGQFPATIIEQFLPLAATHDLVLGFVPRRDSPLAKVLSATERLLFRLLFGPLPRFQGIMMFHRRHLDALPLTSTGRGWTIVMELIIRLVRGGYRVVSVPTEIRPRMSGQSKVNNLRSIWANTRSLVELRGRL